MNNGYSDFKKKILLNHLIRWLVIAISLCLVVFGILFLLSKLKVISLNIGLIIVIALLSGIILFLFTYFIFKPNDKKIAKRLDKDFDLKNRVETMIELKDKEGFVIELQKEDTEEKLKNIPLKSLKFKAPAVLIIASLLGLGTTITAASIPAKSEKIDEEKTYTLTELQIQKIEDLKNKVRATSCEDSLKELYIACLDNLIGELTKGVKESELNDVVLSTISDTLSVNKAYASNKTIGNALNSIVVKEYNTTYAKHLFDQTNKCVGLWQTKGEKTKKIEISSSLVTINSKSYAIDTKTSTTTTIKANLVEDTTQTITIELNKDNVSIKYDNEDYYLVENFKYYRAIGRNLYNNADNLSNLISFLKQDYTQTKNDCGGSFIKGRLELEIESLNTALRASQLTNQNGYYNAITTLVNAYTSVLSEGTATMIKSIESALDTFETNINSIYQKEIISNNTAEMIENSLREIFNIAKSEDSDNKDELKDDDDKTIEDTSSSNKKPNDEDSIGDGAPGKGDPQYASNDKFFSIDSNGNPVISDSNDLYAYAHFYAEYKQMYEELVIEGILTEEEIEDYLEVYFNNLAYGVNKK